MPSLDFLAELNPQQKQAVSTPPGPVLVLAGPGSGKTRVLTHRIAYLIGRLGVQPYNILAVTFTNKAAREMQSRVEKLLGGQMKGLWLGTFHSICARILRRETDLLPLKPNFVIFDDDDQVSLVKRAIRDLDLNDKLYRPTSVHASISKAKNDLFLPDNFPATNHREDVVKKVYARYQELLVANNAVDFDDLLLYTAILLEENPAVTERYARRFEHILVDEFQDTNQAQYLLLRHLASFHHNLFVVGDEDQCLPTGTLIQTQQGQKLIETLQVGECVTAAAGRGVSMQAEITHIAERNYQGDLVRVTTRSGFSFQATPNHVIFTRLGVNPNVHYVYLMYRKDRGYRVGVVVGARTNGIDPEPEIGIKVRIHQEHADRIWILRVCDTRDEAFYWEQFFAFQYGIPTMVFHTLGRKMSFSEGNIERLFREIDTAERAERLLGDLGMDLRFPHYIPRAKLLRHAINLRYFGDGRRSQEAPWNAHRIDLWGSDPELKHKLVIHGYHVRKGKGQTWRLGFSRLHYDDAQTLARELGSLDEDLSIVSGAFLTRGETRSPATRFSLMPASHLHPSMYVAVQRDGEIVEEEIFEVTSEPFEGKVYDLEVANLHNYLANGVVVHNSIYRWRGADYRNVLRFEEDFPQGAKILLEQNYRSTQTVLDAARAVIDQNPNRTPKALFSDRGRGEKIILYEAVDDYAEAAYVVDTIAQAIGGHRAQPGDFAIMYRTNAQSRLLEEAFLRAGLPYRLVGAQRFYGRREVKDAISYLRLVHNPDDEASLGRIINVPPRGIGDKTMVALQLRAQQSHLSVGQILIELSNGPDSPHWQAFSGRGSAILADFGSQLVEWRTIKEQLSLPALFDRILEDTGYHQYIDDQSEEGHPLRAPEGASDRWGNVQELRRLAVEYEERGLVEFLENLALVSDQDTLPETVNAPTLLTLHAAKGLEFPQVMITGLDDGLLPHSRSRDDPEEMAEERRLFYVGLTRAKDRLYLVRAERRGTYGSYEPTIPSSFLSDLPEELLTERRRPTGFRQQRDDTSWQSRGYRSPVPSLYTPSHPVASPLQPRYKSNMRVNHAVYGEGWVLESRIEDGDETVDVTFDTVGFKRLVASLANLTIVKG